MDLSSSHATQLILALVMGISLFVIVYGASEKKIILFLVLLIPFQIINSRYGSINMVLTYLIGASMLLKGSLRYLPIFPVFLFIVFAYLISISQALRPTYFDHILYVLSIGSNFVLFYIIYNYFKRTEDYRFGLKIFIYMNILVAVVGMAQMVIGADRLAGLGIGVSPAELTESRLEGRLIGVFGAPGINAEYYVLQILFIMYLLMHKLTPLERKSLSLLAFINFALMIGTGSRGSFLTLIAGSVLFLILFRKELGVGKAIKLALLGGVGSILIAMIVVNFTSYNKLFERLGETEFDNGVPDTRKYAFDMTIERLDEAIFVGHGPRLRLIDQEKRRISGYRPLPGYPHNLVLFLIYTIGVLGLTAYILMFVSLYIKYMRGMKRQHSDPLLNGLPKLAVLLLTVFLIDQLKIEFLRFRVGDMQNYLFAFWAFMLAVSDFRPKDRGHIEDKRDSISEKEQGDSNKYEGVRLR